MNSRQDIIRALVASTQPMRSSEIKINGLSPATIDRSLHNLRSPDHLSVGTHADNMRDMREKGRSRPGGVSMKPADLTLPLTVVGQ